MVLDEGFKFRWSLLPSVVFGHELREPRLEEHCVLVGWGQGELVEEGVVGVVRLEELADGIIFEEISLVNFGFEDVFESLFQWHGVWELIVEGAVLAHGDGEDAEAVRGRARVAVLASLRVAPFLSAHRGSIHRLAPSLPFGVRTLHTKGLGGIVF